MQWLLLSEEGNNLVTIWRGVALLIDKIRVYAQTYVLRFTFSKTYVKKCMRIKFTLKVTLRSQKKSLFSDFFHKRNAKKVTGLSLVLNET